VEQNEELLDLTLFLQVTVYRYPLDGKLLGHRSRFGSVEKNPYFMVKIQF
jgi:hypothetical protein